MVLRSYLCNIDCSEWKIRLKKYPFLVIQEQTVANVLKASFATGLEWQMHLSSAAERFSISNNSKSSIASLLPSCRSLRVLKSVHAFLIRTNALQSSSLLANQLIDAYSRIHRADHARLVLAQIVHPTTFAYNAVIGALVQDCRPLEVLDICARMIISSVLLDACTLSCLIKACARLSATEFGQAVHAQCSKLGFEGQLVVQTAFIGFYSSLGKISEARKVFDEMTVRDVVSWTAIIRAYSRLGDLALAMKLFDEMPERNTVSWNTIILANAKFANVELACSLFEEMPHKNLVSWTTMISCFCQNKRHKEAVETFERMKAAGFAPDEVTIVTVVAACAHLGALDIGRDIYMYSMLNKFNYNVYIGSAFIDMFAKCGNIERALLIFYKLEERNLFCWNSIIEGLAMHGYGREVMNMFKIMEGNEIMPNEVTFVSILSACNHAGLLEEGRAIFASMTRDYCIPPQLAHYGCMVDLLGRAGHIQEAFALIRSMPIEPNAIIWGSLLSGCKIHGHFAIAEVAIEKLLVLEPSNSAHYMLLLSMYIEARKWEKVKETKFLMKERRVEKRVPAYSWYEKDGIVHEFATSDMLQLSLDHYLLLLALGGMLKLEEVSPEWAQNCSSSLDPVM